MQPRYSTVQIAFHWGMAVAIAVAWILGEAIEDAPRGLLRLEAQGRHALIGLVVLGLVLPRILVRLRGTPPAPAATPRWERMLAQAAHGLLYALMVAIPLTGLAGVLTGGRGVPLPGLGTLPVLWPLAAVHGAAEEVHEVLTKVLVPLLGLHVFAVLWHDVWRRDGVLGRMIPVGRR